MPLFKQGSKGQIEHLKRIAGLGGNVCAKKHKKPVIERFYENICKEKNGCWIWTAALGGGGYGRFKIDGRMTTVTRWAYEHFYQITIPKGDGRGVFVCHHCDNRACVNPEHLFLGTHDDNMRDGRTKGRFVKGSYHPSSKLTENKVRRIRILYGSGKSQDFIAQKFSVSQRVISRIIRREGWKHV